MKIGYCGPQGSEGDSKDGPTGPGPGGPGWSSFWKCVDDSPSGGGACKIVMVYQIQRCQARAHTNTHRPTAPVAGD
jgi:hypothetical protein